VRYFLEYIPYPSGGLDWEAEASRRMVPYNDPRWGAVTFEFTRDPTLEDRIIYDAQGNALLDVGNTTWVQAPVLHITGDGGVLEQPVYWLVGTPEDAEDLQRLLAGATAATGPDGDVVTLAETGVNRDGEGYWRLDNFNPHLRIRISAGLFRK
jgi:hypothetical protein